MTMQRNIYLVSNICWNTFSWFLQCWSIQIMINLLCIKLECYKVPFYKQLFFCFQPNMSIVPLLLLLPAGASISAINLVICTAFNWYASMLPFVTRESASVVSAVTVLRFESSSKSTLVPAFFAAHRRFLASVGFSPRRKISLFIVQSNCKIMPIWQWHNLTVICHNTNCLITILIRCVPRKVFHITPLQSYHANNGHNGNK